MIDYHIHPDYSPDAQGSIQEYAQRALELGLSEICFTTHYDCDPAREEDDQVRVKGELVSVHSDWLRPYFEDVEAARLSYPQLAIAAGLEVGYSPEVEEHIGQILRSYPFDFVMGSIHLFDHLALTVEEESRLIFAGKSAGQVVQRYFKLVEEAVKSGLFDVIGHLDIYRRYGLSFYGDEILGVHQGLVEELFTEMGQKGIGLEINTAGWRHGQGEPYPSFALLKEARARGVTHLTIGSDAHRIGDLGYAVEKAAQLAKAAGYDAHCTFHCRSPHSLLL